jgi:selenide, water dikinase
VDLLNGQATRLTSLSHGAGCACKLPLGQLELLMTSVGASFGPSGGDLLAGAADGDDAAVLRLDHANALVLTTDFFTPIVDVPRDWGRIAAANALSDVYAMGGRPVLALNLTAWPAGRLPMDVLAEVIRGGAEVAATAGCRVVGGHTIDDPEPKYGLAVVGFAHPDHLLTIDRARSGDVLVLTKPIGTGVVATAIKREGATPDVIAAAVASMTALNADASEVALACGVRAATDVTGFGLLGHLHRMLRASGVSADVYAGKVPLLPGVVELADRGFISGGTRANIQYLDAIVENEPGVPAVLSVLLHDAQTSGGLLLAVPRDQAASACRQLVRRGLFGAMIGQVTATGPAGRICVRAGMRQRWG